MHKANFVIRKCLQHVFSKRDIPLAKHVDYHIHVRCTYIVSRQNIHDLNINFYFTDTNAISYAPWILKTIWEKCLSQVAIYLSVLIFIICFDTRIISKSRIRSEHMVNLVFVCRGLLLTFSTVPNCFSGYTEGMLAIESKILQIARTILILHEITDSKFLWNDDWFGPGKYRNVCG